MADESHLLATLTGNRLPALPEPSQPTEPSEPTEGGEVETRGRTPEEVVPQRETPTETPSEETVLPAAPRKAKKGEVKKYLIRGVEYTAAELEAKGLLEDLAITHGKHGHLQEKYNQLLEKVAEVPAKPADAAPPAKPEPAPITNLMIAQTYDDVAKQIVDDLVANKLIDEDLAEAYGRSIKTFIGQSRFCFDKVFQNEAKLDKVIERLEATITYLNSKKAETEGTLVATQYNNVLDALVAKDAKLYGGLKDKKVRDAFTNFLVDEVHASVEQTTGEKAQAFLAKQWVAFNSQAIMDAAKESTADKARRADKRFVTGEGSGTRPGVADNGEAPMLDRMIDNSGKIRQ